MAKKIEVTIKDLDDEVITKFYTKTLTKLVNKIPAGTRLKVYFQENKFGQQFVGDYVTKSPPNQPEEPPVITCPENQHEENGVCVPDVIPDPDPTHECPEGQHWDDTEGKCMPDEIEPPTCPPGQHLENGVCVPDVITPPPEPTGDVLYDSERDSNLHDGQEGTFTKIGNIAAGGLGLECRASGSPKIRKNPDKTFSLICQAGHGRFYGYCKNYNATLEIECAFWNEASGQDLSLKMRSRHNEGGECDHRFGGYGYAADRSGWGAKREPCHNTHDQSTSGNLPSIQTKQYFKTEFTVKDEGGSVRQIVKHNGQQVMSKTDSSPKPYMRDQASFAAQSYFWVRQNIDSGSGEIRIKRLRILKA